MRRAGGAGLLLLGLAGCTTERPLAPFPGAEAQIRSYYERYAWEMNAYCTLPRINTITASRVVEDTPQRLVLDIRYRYEPFNQTIDFGILACKNWASRTFTFDRVDGGLQLVGMSGEQRRQAVAP